MNSWVLKAKKCPTYMLNILYLDHIKLLTVYSLGLFFKMIHFEI